MLEKLRDGQRSLHVRIHNLSGHIGRPPTTNLASNVSRHEHGRPWPSGFRIPPLTVTYSDARYVVAVCLQSAPLIDSFPALIFIPVLLCIVMHMVRGCEFKADIVNDSCCP